MPREGTNRKEYRTAKFGSWERSLTLDDQVAAAGRAEGIPFDYAKVMRTPNTLDAHRLIGLADTEGVQDAVVEAVFQAYFVEGRDISQTTVLDVVVGAGLDRARCEAVLSGEQGLAAIRAAEEQAHRTGVQGVPYFLINNTVALSRAREPSAFLDAFEQAGAGPTTSDEGVCKVGPGGAVMLDGKGTAPKVVVIGGSFGGLFNATALRSLGCEVEVFEKSSGLMKDRGRLHERSTRLTRPVSAYTPASFSRNASRSRSLNGIGVVVIGNVHRLRL
jgi:predicted DsbA family dithiol-disulfide isomerase